METKAYAKINLTLEVLGHRPDGYHEVRTVLQTIDLADRLQFSLAPRLEMDCSAPELSGEDNLAVQAAAALRNATGCDKGVKVRLEKHIPVGMGLGGGSSDAAATLKALNRLWGLDLGDDELGSIASSLGSDVTFFLRGGTALGEGRGEVIFDLPPSPQRWMVLLCPLSRTPEDIPSPTTKTARLYSMLSHQHHTDGGRTGRLVDALKAGRFSEDLLYNVFEQVAPSAFLCLSQVQGVFLEALPPIPTSTTGARRVHLSGTGPALYAFVSSKEEGERIVKLLKSMEMKAYCVSTISPNE